MSAEPILNLRAATRTLQSKNATPRPGPALPPCGIQTSDSMARPACPPPLDSEDVRRGQGAESIQERSCRLLDKDRSCRLLDKCYYPTSVTAGRCEAPQRLLVLLDAEDTLPSQARSAPGSDRMQGGSHRRPTGRPAAFNAHHLRGLFRSESEGRRTDPGNGPGWPSGTCSFATTQAAMK